MIHYSKLFCNFAEILRESIGLTGYYCVDEKGF